MAIFSSRTWKRKLGRKLTLQLLKQRYEMQLVIFERLLHLFNCAYECQRNSIPAGKPNA